MSRRPLDQVAGLTRARLPVERAVTIQQSRDQLGSDRRPPALGILLENLGILFRGRRPQKNAIPHPAQKGRVSDHLRAQVGGDDQHVAQRQLNLLTRAQGEIIDLVLHRRDETIEQLVR